MLLIVSNKTDLATDYLILRLRERNIPFIRINTEDYLSLWNVNFTISNDNLEIIIKKEGNAPIPVDIITGAYIRQPKMPSIDVVAEDKEFAKREIGETLKSLWRAIGDDVWLNAPYRLLRASNKPEQLSIARSIGFIIPDTYIGIDYKCIKDFLKSHSSQVIAKAVKHGFNFEGDKARIAATQIFDQCALDKIKSYATLPMIFQHQIEKKYDIRVIVVGKKVFATAINSQDHEETKVDWRLSDCYKISLDQHGIILPQEIEEKCLEMNNIFNLRYSAIDLILGKDGVFYFLELNPNGQWAWLEQLGIHKIRDAIIDELLLDKTVETM